MNYYIEQNGKIVLFDTEKERLQRTLEFTPQYADLEIKETNRPIENFQFADTEEYQEEQAQARELAFNESFFNTSLGYIRRKVTMKDGSTKDFLTDILPLLQVDVPIISYDKPDFTVDEMPKQNTDKLVTEEFINECKQQVLKDFYGAAGSGE